uniref:CSON008897 protein n=1 Tax=Culicoides sonorensis TaxID=179676 RepID=A0A336LFT7_CULSO
MSECSFEGNFQGTNQNQSTPNRKIDEITESPSLKSENRNSIQSENSSEGAVVRRNMAKHQRPLTRYLPIFSELNLREHIESAGHQIALCPHVFVDQTTCKGYLHKIGNYFGWNKRWFVLDREKRAFIYYTDKTEKKVRGGAYFSAIDEVYLDHLNVTKSNRPHSTFIVKTKKRLYHLQAPSDQAARIWIDAIITGAQGNLSEFYDYFNQ